MPRTVLISYLDRNKAFSIPDNKDVYDVEYLRGEFIKAFSFHSRNVNIEITFQKYDGEWDAYVDLEDDSTVDHRDKLKAVVMPLLRESSTCSTPTAINLPENASCKMNSNVSIQLNS